MSTKEALYDLDAVDTPESFQSRSFKFALEILKTHRQLKQYGNIPTHLLNQMLRAGTSVGANLAESKSAYSRRDLTCKQSIALREARECRYWLRLIAADQPATAKYTPALILECSEFVAMLTASVKKLRKERKGTSEG